MTRTLSYLECSDSIYLDWAQRKLWFFKMILETDSWGISLAVLTTPWFLPRWLPSGGDKVSMLTHTYEHKPLRNIEVTICNHQADSPLYVWPDVWSGELKVQKKYGPHDTECPYWDLVSLNNTNQIPTGYLELFWHLPCDYGNNALTQENNNCVVF